MSTLPKILFLFLSMTGMIFSTGTAYSSDPAAKNMGKATQILFNNGTPFKKNKLQKPPKKVPAYTLSMCCIFQDDSKYLPEWIEFHYAQGVQHFYLFNNRSQDNYMDYLRPYMDQGIVELIEWPQKPNTLLEWNTIQCSAYMHCIQKDRGRSKWIAILDSDEFLFSPSTISLKELLTDYEKFAAVCVNWVLFGTGGVDKILPGEKLIERLTSRGFINREDNKHVKTIVQPKYVKECNCPHFFIYKKGHFAVNENKERVDGPFTQTVSVNLLRINHYWSRDMDFFFNHKIARRLLLGQSVLDCIEYEKGMNEEFDDSILH